MTRKEKQKAIDALKISAPVMAVTQEEFKDYIQTLNKIMDWLEQEPTTNNLAVDCIVDVLGSYTDLDIPYKREIAENILTKLSSVTPQEPRWIPVSERLPEDRELVLFSTKTDRVFEGRFFADSMNRQWYSFRDETFAWNNVVTAWMPLPAPFEPQESEET